jgi:hypothetical protein
MTSADPYAALLDAIRAHSAARLDLERVEAGLPTDGPDAAEWLGALALRAAARERVEAAAKAVERTELAHRRHLAICRAVAAGSLPSASPDARAMRQEAGR